MWEGAGAAGQDTQKPSMVLDGAILGANGPVQRPPPPPDSFLRARAAQQRAGEDSKSGFW
ncbi:hypothetical protein SM139_0824 [Stenotrophomonas maltophilia]|nr:hypothetical protein SM139_0824 [Stenotrophomonas maltophilia]